MNATPAGLKHNFGRGYALRRLARSVLLNQIMMRRIRDRNFAAEPQLAIFSHDLIGQAINIYGWWEHEQLLLLRSFVLDRIGRGGALLDVGANIGNHSVYLQDLFDEVHAVEADARTFRLLQFNVEQYRHIHAHNFAASDQDGLLDFVIDQVNVGASHIAEGPASGTAHGSRTSVIARAIDNQLTPRLPVRLIKMDVEGHELRCIRGLVNTILRDRPLIVFEQHLQDFSAGTTPVIEELRSIGYREFHAVIRRPGGTRNGLRGQLWSLLSSALLGFRIEAVPTEYFEADFYEMIIASPGQLTRRLESALSVPGNKSESGRS